MKSLPLEDNFLALNESYSLPENSDIAILSAPYEHTVSYGGGTARGPEGIIKASQFVEFYDDEFDRQLCFERGITTLEPLDFGEHTGRQALDMLESAVDGLLQAGKFVVTLGGEHTIAAAPIAAHYRKHPEMSVLQFDAHSDLREEYQGSPYSHACVMARVCDFFPPSRVTQVGIRAQCIEEALYIRENGINTFYASAIRRGAYGEGWVQSIVDTLSDEVYITFDVDAFDPSIMPSTGTPEPEGLSYTEAMAIFREIRKQGKRIIGLDVVELAPVEGVNYPDITTARLIYKILNFAF